MAEFIGWLIAAVLLVSSAKGFRCWYQEAKKKLENK